MCNVCIEVWMVVVVVVLDDNIRQCVFMALDERFDPHLAQAENLTTLFVAMHDGVRPQTSVVMMTETTDYTMSKLSWPPKNHE